MHAGRELSEKRFQLDALDGLRGLAVLIVILSHASNSGMHLLPGVDLGGIGKTGVYLFFVLSSFLLTYPFIERAQEALRWRFLANYFLRRFLRIYPLYCLFLLTTLVATRLARGDEGLLLAGGLWFTLTGPQLVDHLLLREGFSVTWSIVVEFRYYFVLPVLALVFAIVLRRRVAWCAALTALLCGASLWLWPPRLATADPALLKPYLPIFFCGALLAVLHHAWLSRTPATRQRWQPALELAGFFAAAAELALVPALASLLLGERVAPGFSHKQFLLHALLWSVLLFATVHGTGHLRRLFESRFLRYLGFISFSAYLWHVVIHDVLVRYASGAALAGWGLLIGTIGLAHLTWRWVEKPASRIALRARPAPPPPATAPRAA